MSEIKIPNYDEIPTYEEPTKEEIIEALKQENPPQYDAPMTIIKSMYDAYKYDIEKHTMEAIRHYDIEVDKEELIKALNYDRHEYERGYEDGIRYKADLLEKFVDYLSDKNWKLWREYNKQYEESPQPQNDDEEMDSDTSLLLGICGGISMVTRRLYRDLKNFLEREKL